MDLPQGLQNPNDARIEEKKTAAGHREYLPVVRKNSAQPKMTGSFSFNASCFQREDPARAGDCSDTESRCLHLDLPNRPAPNACTSSTACRLQTFRQETKAKKLGPAVLFRGLKHLEGLANGVDHRYTSNGTSLESFISTSFSTQHWLG